MITGFHLIKYFWPVPHTLVLINQDKGGKRDHVAIPVVIEEKNTGEVGLFPPPAFSINHY
jgi:hypothetical protein